MDGTMASVRLFIFSKCLASGDHFLCLSVQERMCQEDMPPYLVADCFHAVKQQSSVTAFSSFVKGLHSLQCLPKVGCCVSCKFDSEQVSSHSIYYIECSWFLFLQFRKKQEKVRPLQNLRISSVMFISSWALRSSIRGHSWSTLVVGMSGFCYFPSISPTASLCEKLL